MKALLRKRHVNIREAKRSAKKASKEGRQRMAQRLATKIFAKVGKAGKALAEAGNCSVRKVGKAFKCARVYCVENGRQRLAASQQRLSKNLGRQTLAKVGKSWQKLLPMHTSQIFSSAAHEPEKAPTGTGMAGCAAGGAASKPGTPVRGPVLPLLRLDTLARGSVLPPLEPGRCRTRSSKTSLGRKAPGPAAHIDGLGVPSAGQVLTKPEPGRRFVPGGRFVPVAGAGGAGQDAGPKAGLRIPGRGFRSAPGPHWPGQGQAQDYRSTAPSTTLGGNRVTNIRPYTCS
jgi:hypothetical protein